MTKKSLPFTRPSLIYSASSQRLIVCSTGGDPSIIIESGNISDRNYGLFMLIAKYISFKTIRLNGGADFQASQSTASI